MTRQEIEDWIDSATPHAECAEEYNGTAYSCTRIYKKDEDYWAVGFYNGDPLAKNGDYYPPYKVKPETVLIEEVIWNRV
jgi:hypothetical protein